MGKSRLAGRECVCRSSQRWIAISDPRTLHGTSVSLSRVCVCPECLCTYLCAFLEGVCLHTHVCLHVCVYMYACVCVLLN